MRYGATGSMSGRRTFFGQTGRRLIGPGATGQAETFGGWATSPSACGYAVLYIGSTGDLP